MTTLNNFDQTWGIQQVQVGQLRYFRRDRARQGIVVELPMAKKWLERRKKRRTRPTLNKACDQHSSKALFGTYRDNVDICDGILP